MECAGSEILCPCPAMVRRVPTWTLWARSLSLPGGRKSSQARAISIRDRHMELGHDSSAGAQRCSAVSCSCRKWVTKAGWNADETRAWACAGLCGRHRSVSTHLHPSPRPGFIISISHQHRHQHQPSASPSASARPVLFVSLERFLF